MHDQTTAAGSSVGSVECTAEPVEQEIAGRTEEPAEQPSATVGEHTPR